MHDERVVALTKAFESSVEEGEKVLAADPESLNLQTSLGETSLHLMCFGNSVGAIRELIARGATVNTVSCAGSTPLSDAASLGHAELVQVLLDAGALISVEGQQDPTLHQAVRSGSVQIVQKLLDAGANVNEQGPLSESPLHIAAEDDRAEIARLLLSRGADASLRRVFDETALEVAVQSGSQSCIDVLSPRH